MSSRAQFCHPMLLLLAGEMALRDMWLKTFVKVEHARNRIDDGDCDQKQCDNS